jgi:hypothetical protein
MADTPEELAMDLSRASLQAQEQTEDQLRQKATTVLSAASIVVPVAALAVGHGPAGAAIPFGSAVYMDQSYRHNHAILEASAVRVRHAIVMLTVEILALVAALTITIMS